MQGVSATSAAGTLGVMIENNTPSPTRVTMMPDLAARLDEAKAEDLPEYLAAPVAVMATDHGTHTPQAWAEVTCAQLIQTDPASQSNSAREFERQVLGILTAAFALAIVRERQALASDPWNLLATLDVNVLAGSVYRTISDVAADTPWSAHYRDVIVTDASVRVLIKDLSHAIRIERETFAKNSPDSEPAQEYLKRLAN